MTAPETPESCDVAVIGAGIVGLAVARELLERNKGLRLVIFEREADIGTHQTGHSSGVVHAGIYYEPGSLKARLCVEGAKELFKFCEQRGIPAERRGKLIVALEEDELPRLDELERRGRANKVKGLRRIAGDEIAEIEPHARGLAALHSPNTGAVDFKLVARALAVEVAAHGAQLVTDCDVRRMREEDGALRIAHRHGKTRAGAAVACAGLWSDRLASASGGSSDPRIVPFRGAYLQLRPELSHLVRGNVYGVPDPDLPFLGIHFTRQIDGTVTLGPTAQPVLARNAYNPLRVSPRDAVETLAWPGSWRMAGGWWRTGVGELRRASRRVLVGEASRYVPGLKPGDFVSGPAGVRAQALGRDGALLDDFLVERTGRAIHVRNAPSPAATSALALAKLIADRLAEGTDLK